MTHGRVSTNHREDLGRIAVGVMFIKGLQPEFSPEVQQQLNGIEAAALEDDPSIRDLTKMLWCSIDNDDSKDLDQLTCCKLLPGGVTRIFVAVADVDAIVKKNSPIDEHAYINTTSVYTSARIFPMLPLRLSNDLTSLNPDQDRLAITSEMDFSADGELLRSDIYRARVRNKAQLAYDAISSWLEGQAELSEAASRINGMDEQLRTQDALAQQLRKLRHEQGSLEFEILQPHAVFDGDLISDIKVQPHNRARQLIEELMIATNGCTARFLAAQGVPSMRRVVRSPERWLRIVEVARSHGVGLPKVPETKALENFLAKEHRTDPVHFPDLSLKIVKLMGSGEYVVEHPSETPIGHFGLAVHDYMHSTAPNRRYPDLITIRLIKACIKGDRSPYTNGELEDLALHCTSQEDSAKKVERQMRKSEAALLLQPRIGQQFSGVVTGVGPSGTWVRIFEPPAEGKLVGNFPDYEDGHAVQVKLVSTNVERGFVDFTIID